MIVILLQIIAMTWIRNFNLVYIGSGSLTFPELEMDSMTGDCSGLSRYLPDQIFLIGFNFMFAVLEERDNKALYYCTS